MNGLMEVRNALDEIQQMGRRPLKVFMSKDFMSDIYTRWPQVVEPSEINSVFGVPLETDDNVNGFEIELVAD